MATEGFNPSDDLSLGQTLRGFIAGQKLFKRYTLKRILGRGGMGVVWLALDQELEREVAMKFLPELVASDRNLLTDLKRETRKSLELTHPNIVRIHDFISDDLCAAISMEYVDGATLSNLRLDQPGHVFTPEQLTEWLRRLCAALDYAHEEAKVVHRDLKPANIMVNSRGQVKVTDFGIARSLSDSVSQATMHLGISGTLVYMSPQQAMGDRATRTDDIYSLGATLYELLTGKPPFYSGDIPTQIKEKVPPSLVSRREEFEIKAGTIPVEWEQTIAACLAKDPAQRPQSCQELFGRLELSQPKSGMTETAKSGKIPQIPTTAAQKQNTVEVLVLNPTAKKSEPIPAEDLSSGLQKVSVARLNPWPNLDQVIWLFAVIIALTAIGLPSQGADMPPIAKVFFASPFLLLTWWACHRSPPRTTWWRKVAGFLKNVLVPIFLSVNSFGLFVIGIVTTDPDNAKSTHGEHFHPTDWLVAAFTAALILSLGLVVSFIDTRKWRFRSRVFIYAAAAACIALPLGIIPDGWKEDFGRLSHAIGYGPSPFQAFIEWKQHSNWLSNLSRTSFYFCFFLFLFFILTGVFEVFRSLRRKPLPDVVTS